jgi:uncharacterized protein (UPF0332 family)
VGIRRPATNWWDLSQESAEGARAAEAAECWRSSASRYYYAAYQSVTALLLHVGLAPPGGREAWSHDDTPELVREHLRGVIRSRDQRNDVADRLRRLYKTRLGADYVSADPITSKTLETVRKDAGYIIKVAQSILPQEGE